MRRSLALPPCPPARFHSRVGPDGAPWNTCNPLPSRYAELCVAGLTQTRDRCVLVYGCRWLLRRCQTWSLVPLTYAPELSEKDLRWRMTCAGSMERHPRRRSCPGCRDQPRAPPPGLSVSSTLSVHSS